MKMRKIGALAVVELKKLYRDPMNLAVMLLMPVGLTMVYWLAMIRLPRYSAGETGVASTRFSKPICR